MWKKVTAFFCVILAAALVGLFAVQRQQEVDKKQELADVNTEIQQLETEKKQLERQLNALTGQENTEETGESSGVVCFTSIDRSVFTQAYPKLRAREYTGVFIMKDGKLPGDYNTITVEECLELLNAGWSYGISLTDEFASEESWQASVQEYLDDLRARISVLPSVYCFEEGEYSADSVAFLAKNGFSAVLYDEKEQPEAVEGIVQIPLYGYLDGLSDLNTYTWLGLEVQIVWDEDTDTSLRYTVDDLSDVLEHSTVTISSLSEIVEEWTEQGTPIQPEISDVGTLQKRISEIEDEIKQLYH